MARYRKRPVEIEAVQFDGSPVTLSEFLHAGVFSPQWRQEDDAFFVWNTADYAWLPLPVGHWLIRGVEGEVYPCKPSVFDATYEPVDES